MRKAQVIAAIALLVAAGPAAAQAQQPPAQPPKDERPPLNLKLDQPARLYVRETAPEGAEGKAAAGNLPSLGGGAATSERPSEPRVRTPTSPFPKDSENPR
jgi:hypothetical protein